MCSLNLKRRPCTYINVHGRRTAAKIKYSKIVNLKKLKTNCSNTLRTFTPGFYPRRDVANCIFQRKSGLNEICIIDDTHTFKKCEEKSDLDSFIRVLYTHTHTHMFVYIHIYNFSVTKFGWNVIKLLRRINNIDKPMS